MTAMTSAELSLILQSLGLSDQQAALIFSVRDRTVRRWKAGDSPIPAEVAAKIGGYDARMESAVRNAVEHFLEADDRPAAVHLLIYATDADYVRYRPHDDTPFAAMHRALVDRLRLALQRLDQAVRIVEMRPDDYEAWRTAEGLEDREDTRAAWAALQIAE